PDRSRACWVLAHTMWIQAVRTVLPDHRYGQERITEAVQALLPADPQAVRRFHLATGVTGRNLALPLERYGRLGGFTEANDAYLEVALDLGGAGREGGARGRGPRPRRGGRD